MIIHVTREDIAAGDAGACCFCPVALALRRQTKLLWEVSFSDAEHSDYGKIDLSRSAKRFIKRFDGGKRARPFSFKFNCKLEARA